MTDEYHMSDKEKDKLAQSMGFDSWNDYINLDTSRVPEKETKTMLRDSSMSHVPDLTLSEEERDRLSRIRSDGVRNGGRIGGRATVETHGDQMRKGGLRGHWRDNPELLEEICELKYGEGLTWKDTTDEFNRRHGTEYKSWSLEASYRRNKHLLADEEE